MKTYVLLAILSLAWLETLVADTVVNKGSADWSYLHITNGVDPAIADTDFNSTWFNPSIGGYSGASYDGPAFATGGSAPFEYGGVDGISGGTELANPGTGKDRTTYFYRIFDGGNGFSDLQLSLLADDGAFVYLNGVLIARDGVTDPDTFSKTSSLGNEYDYDDIPIIGSPVVRPGLNLIALSVHQTSTTSSDLGFDLELNGTPLLGSTFSGGWAMLSPISSGDGFDPATGDADFNTTWHSQSFGGYGGGSYDGPAFTTGLTGPFAYGGVDGITAPFTAIPQPSSGTRGSAYFLKEIDGGVNGHDGVRIRMLADDGAYVYLNGNLVAVIGDLPAGAGNDTWGQQTGAGGSETTIHEVILFGSQILQPGANLLAISLHNTALTSSDLGFTFEMIGYVPQVPVVVRGPYLQAGGEDRMTVRWRTNSPGNTVVRYGDAPGNLTESFSIAESVTEHIATITGLAPNTVYFYQIETSGAGGVVTAGADSGYSFKTHPVPGTRQPTRIWVIGDSGTTSAAKQNVYGSYLTRTGATRTDAWLMLGDNAYNSGTDSEFQAAVFDSYPELLRNTVLWSCIGNHEAVTQAGQPYLNLHSFPTAGESGGVPSGSEHYYSFDHGNIHFVCVDSQTSGNYNDLPGGGGMVDWLELDLQSTDKDWIIAYMHHGPYTKGSHNSDTESHHIVMRQYVTPLLEKYGVDLVFSGHSHCYERSMLVNGHHSNMTTADSTSGTFLASNIVDGGNGSDVGRVDGNGAFVPYVNGAVRDGAYQKPLATGEAGTVYSTCGASGKLSNWTGGSGATVNPSPHPVFIVNLRVMGSMILDVDGNTLHAQYIDDANAVRDDFTLVKGSTVEIEAVDDGFGEKGANVSSMFEIRREGATALAEDVSYQIGGTAINGTDYTPMLTGGVSFAAGETVKQITATRVADALAEGAETLELTLLDATGTVAGGTGLRSLYFVGAGDSDVATLLDAPSQNWWFGAFGGAALAAGDWDLDTDGDGLNRLEEMAYGGTEGVDDRALLPYFSATQSDIELHYLRNNAIPDLDYKVLRSIDLLDWNDTDVTDVLDGAANPTGIEGRKGVTGMDLDRAFLRLEIELLE